MGTLRKLLNPVVAALLLGCILVMPVAAAPVNLDQAFIDLKSDDAQTWQRAQSDILREWSKSGSPAMDLLLERGRAAMKDGDNQAAIGHLTALIDHAPDFAEAYNARAEAYFHAGLDGPALKDLAVALRLNPRHFGAMTGLGAILQDIDKPSDALAAYRMSLAIHPHQPEVLSAVKRLEAQVGGHDL